MDPTAFQVDERRLPTKKQLRQMLAAPCVTNQFVPRSLQESFQTITEIESQQSLEDKANCPFTSRVWARVWMAVRSTRLNNPSIRAAHVLLSRKLRLEAGGTGVLCPSCLYCGEQTPGACRKVLQDQNGKAIALCGAPNCKTCQTMHNPECANCSAVAVVPLPGTRTMQ